MLHCRIHFNNQFPKETWSIFTFLRCQVTPSRACLSPRSWAMAWFGSGGLAYQPGLAALDPGPRCREAGAQRRAAQLGPQSLVTAEALLAAGWAVSPVLPGPRAEGAAGAAEPPREKAGTADAPHVYPRLRGRPGTGVTCGCGTVLTGSSSVGTSFDPNELLGEKGPVRGGCVACDSMGDSGILTAVKELCIYTCVF